jgi:hypothetical protein
MADRRGARPPWRTLAVAVATVLLAGCAQPATLVTDAVFDAVYLSRSDAEERFADAARATGHRLHRRTLETLPAEAEAVREVLARAGERGPVAVSPLLAAAATEAAATLDREVELLLLGASQAEPGATGEGGAGAGSPTQSGAVVTTLRHDRRAAFEELGRRIAERLDGDEPGRAVFYVHTDVAERRGEVAALRRGLGRLEGAARFVEIDHPVDVEALREELFRVRSPETVVVGAFLGPGNETVLNEVAGAERAPPVVATEDLGPTAAYAETVLYSVERGYAGALEAFLAGDRGEIVAAARLVMRESR